jgi:hypothetical protein
MKKNQVTKQHNDECKRLLRLMGVPVIDAPSEAEAQCAEMAKGGLVYGVATEDMDCLTFGAPRCAAAAAAAALLPRCCCAARWWSVGVLVWRTAFLLKGRVVHPHTPPSTTTHLTHFQSNNTPKKTNNEKAHPPPHGAQQRQPADPGV